MNKAKSKVLSILKRYTVNTVVFYIILPLSVIKEMIQHLELFFNIIVAN